MLLLQFRPIPPSSLSTLVLASRRFIPLPPLRVHGGTALEAVLTAVFAPPDLLLVVRQGTLTALHIDLARGVVSGEPLNEPYVSYGPFVMNTAEEIKQAVEDYNAGKFGFLKD